MKNTEKRRMSPRPRKEIDTSTFEGRFAVRLRMLREKAGLTVEDLAAKSGVPRTTIFSWESASRKPLLDDKLLKLADSLNVKVRTLLPEK